MVVKLLPVAVDKAEKSLRSVHINGFSADRAPKIAREITRFSQNDIDYLFQFAKKIKRSPFFDIKQAPPRKQFGRILLVISKKVGSAPIRNKIKRLVRSIFYENRLYECPFDWVFIAKPSIKTLSSAKIKELLMEVFSNDQAADNVLH
jgi:ribonuclease P protein component